MGAPHCTVGEPRVVAEYRSAAQELVVADPAGQSCNDVIRMDSGYFDDAILETIESLGGKYVIKGKGYPTLVVQVTDPSITFVTGASGRETTELVTALNTWKEDRRSGRIL